MAKTKPEVEVKDDFEGIEETQAEVETKPEPKAKPAKPAKKAAKGTVITYIGQGETPPNKINFMNRQEFVRGRAVDVTDEIVLAKVKNNPCFVEGEVDLEELAEADEKATEKANKQRKEDQATNATFKKRHG